MSNLKINNHQNSENHSLNKELNLLSRKDFKEILECLNLPIKTYNTLITAHIATVVAQSQGIKKITINSKFVVLIAQLNGNENIYLNTPIPQCEFRVELTNRGYITPNSYTGSSLNVWHENGFDFYRPSHLHTWIKEQTKELKSYPQSEENFEDFGNFIDIKIIKTPKKNSNKYYENNLIIHKEVIDNNPIVKSFLTNYFLTENLKEKNNPTTIRKIKI